MKMTAQEARPLGSRVVAYAVILCLLFSPCAAPSVAAQVRRRAMLAPTRIEVAQKDPTAVFRRESGVTLVARVFARNGEELEGDVKWSAAGSEAVDVVRVVNEGSKHEATLVAFDPDGRRAGSATISVTARIGSMSHTMNVNYRAAVTVSVEKDAGAPPKLTPGETYTLRAFVKDGDDDISNAEVKWAPADSADRDLVLVVRDPQAANTFNVIGRKPPKGKAVPDRVILAATYGNAIKLVTIPYGDGTKTEDEKPKVETAKVEDITVERTGGASPFESSSEYQIEPGQRLSLTAKVQTPTGDTKEKPEAVWSIPKEMSMYIAMLPQSDEAKKKGEVVFFGLTPEAGAQADATVRESLYVLVKAKDVVKAVPIRNGEQTVDVSWDILSPAVVAKIYGRNISDKYYAIKVTVGNNSGHDLQLTGVSFRLDNSSLPNVTPNSKQSRVSTVNYAAVRGMNEQRRFAFNRSTILGGLDAAAQIMTGFTPFFQVATRARNFSQGINILGNPVTKGIERVWPDPQQDELTRLDQQALHDEKIIHNNDVESTTVFLSKDGIMDKKDENNMALVRERLGQLTLVGSKLNRNDFQLRVQPSIRQSSGGTSRN